MNLMKDFWFDLNMYENDLKVFDDFWNVIIKYCFLMILGEYLNNLRIVCFCKSRVCFCFF